MLQSSPTIVIAFSWPQHFLIVTRCLKVSVIIANILTFLIGAAHIKKSTNVHQQLQNMLYTPILLTCTKKVILLGRSRLRALVVLVFAHDMQIQVSHAVCKQGCRMISHTANKRVTIVTSLPYSQHHII